MSTHHHSQRPTFSPAVLSNETLLTVILTIWCERRVRSGWVGCVVSSASAPFSVLSLKLVFAFSGSMPLNEMIPEAASICLFLSFLFFFFKIIKLKLSAAFPFVYQSELHAYWECKIKSSTLIFLDQRLVKKKNLIIFNLCISYLNKLFTMPAYIIYLIVILFRDVVECILKPHIQMMCFDRLCSLV